jgi:hypothetical protein
MELVRIRKKKYAIEAYAVPTCSSDGLVTIWRGRHAKYEGGFVIRFFWLGFVLRWRKR